MSEIENAVEPVAVKPLDMFMHNVDAWGAAEWFGRLADAVRGHDAARISGDEFADITADTFKNIMTSSAFRLVRDFEAQVHSALATPSTDLREENAALRETLEKLKRMAMLLRGDQAYREYPKAVLNVVADALSKAKEGKQ